MPLNKYIVHQLSKHLDLDDPMQVIQDLNALLKKNEAAYPISEDQKTLIFNLENLIEWIQEKSVHDAEMLTVAQRNIDVSNRELYEKNLETQSLLNSIGDGYLGFGSDGICLPLYSAATIDLLEVVPAGKHIFDVLKIDSNQKKTLNKWIAILFNGKHNFANIAALGPRVLVNSKGQILNLEYKPVYDKEALKHVVVIASDKTANIKAIEQAKEATTSLQMILKIMSNKYNFHLYIKELQHFLAQSIKSINEENLTKEFYKNLISEAHTLKGMSLSFSTSDISSSLNDFETVLKKSGSSKELYDAIHIVDQRLKDLLSKYSLIIGFSDEAHSIREIDVASIHHIWNEFYSGKSLEEIATEYINLFILKPVFDLIRPQDMIVQSVSERFDKKVKPLILSGTNFLIYPEKYKHFFSNLVHLFSNSVYHGIEHSEIRKSKGKPAEGTITVNCELIKSKKSDKSGNIYIVISDDGAGFNIERIREKIKEVYPHVLLVGLSDNDLILLLFEYPVSTSDTVHMVAGRATGMLSLKQAIDELGGDLKVENSQGFGAKILISLPYILPASHSKAVHSIS